MENAELYAVYNSMQKQDTYDILKEFAPQLAWSFEDEYVLDVGCGPGDVTADIILPQLPRFASIVGVDISTKMVEYANKKYSNEKLSFRALDFSTKNIAHVFPEKNFSKLFSFYCLHWIQDQQQVAKNIFSLLRPGGEFLILMSTNNNLFVIYKILSEMEKWKYFMKNLDDITPWFMKNPHKNIKNIWNSQGLEIITCVEREQTVAFPSMRILLRSIEAINPFVKWMNQDTREQYMEAFEQIMEENRMVTETVTGEVLIQNKMIVIHGRKPFN